MISFIIPFRSTEVERIRSFDFVYTNLKKDWPNEEIVVADVDIAQYGRAFARNRGAATAEGDVLIFTDADSYVPRQQIETALSGIGYGLHGWLLPYSTYYSLTQQGTETFYASKLWNPSSILYEFPDPINPSDRPAAVGGMVMVHKKAFEEVHGYDERFIGWGWEDTAFALSLATLVNTQERIPGPLFHLWHPSIEQDCFDHEHLEHNRALYNRYLLGVQNPEMMRALVGEH